MCLSCHQQALRVRAIVVDGNQVIRYETMIGGRRKLCETAKIRGLVGRQREEIGSCISVALCQGTGHLPACRPPVSQ